MMKIVKAIVAEPPKKNSVKLAETPKPIPKRNEALLRPLFVGVDGTDREINEGIYGTPPKGCSYIVLGHESVAEISEIRGHTKDFSEGDLVVPTVRRPCKENCLNCRSGESDFCLTGNFFEHGISKLHGFASQYAVSNTDFLVKIPESLKDVAVLLEPLSIVEKAVEQSFRIQKRNVWEPNRAFVLGAGPLGLLTTMILRLRNLETYTAATRRKESAKARITRRVGATYINVKETPILRLSEKFDLVFEATGKVEPALDALNLLGQNSVMCLLGVYRENRTCREFGKVLANAVLGNHLIFGSVSSNKKHFEKGLNDMLEIRNQYGNILEKLISKKLKPTEFKSAFNPKRENIKTVISFE